MDSVQKIIKISVRNLVEFIMRSGDIDNRRGSFNDKDAMQAGSRIHRKIQRSMGGGYQAEYALKTAVPAENFEISIEGRADGVLLEGSGVTIDEIKGVYSDLDYLNAPIQVHRAQAMCYAYIYAKDNELSEIGIRMTYCNLDTEQLKYFEEKFTYKELEHWFLELVREYKKWARFRYEWHQTRTLSIQELQFPFAYRAGQKDLAASVYRTIYHKKRLFIQAPTGVGKTISAVFPAVKAVGEELGDKIFYLTAKTITRTVAKDTFDLLRAHGLKYKVVLITAKEKLCLCDEMNCNPVNCPYAKGHYDRVNDAVYELITTADSYSREVILEHAEKWMVCPFEMCLDISEWADAVICDYNYVFDPNVSLKRYFSEGIKGDYIFLIDEAHNLVERGREMFSASLYKEDFLELRRVIKPYSPKIEKLLAQCNHYLLEYKRECNDFTIITDIGFLIVALMNLAGEMEKFLEEQEALMKEKEEVRKKVLDFYLELRNFLLIFERVDDHYVIYTEHESSGRFKLKLFCIDTSRNLKACLDKGNSSIFFSATLLPIQYYQSLLSGDLTDYSVYAESPFDQDKRLLMVGKDVSTKYARRNAREYQRLASYIYQTVQIKTGNYLIFFPSYRLLEDIYECYRTEFQNEEITCILQQPHMNEEMREDFLSAFTEEREHSLIGFCVMGGIFAEGIDLKNDSLIGTLIIGTGLPQVCNEREILKQYYDKRRDNGFNYAYLYPGMNKVLQSAGRVIRTTKDRGVILLLDERFLSNQYRRLFPREWEKYGTCTLRDMGVQLQDFWNAKNNL